MLRYIIKRLLLMIPVLIGVIALVFTILWFSPGDVVSSLTSDLATEEQKAEVRHDLGLDRPFIVQLGDYVLGVFTRFDLGTSLVNKTNISKDLASRFPNSLRIAVIGISMSIIIGVPLGVYAALNQNKAGDAAAMAVALLGVSTPGFWIALMLMLLFAYRFPILPAFGLGSWKHWVLPGLATSMMGVARQARQSRSSMLEVIRSDYVMMAKAKGLTARRVIWRHALPNALMPLITVAGMSFGALLGGGLIVERVFSIPGLGGYLVDAVNSRDFRAVQGAVVLTSLCFCVVMLFCDILMAAIDPRIKAQYAGKRRRKKHA